MIDNINFREYVLRSIEIQLKDRDRDKDYNYALEGKKKMKILFSVLELKIYYSNFKMIMVVYKI